MANTTKTTAEKKHVFKTFVEGAKKVYPDRYAPVKLLKANKEDDSYTLPGRIEIDASSDKILCYFTDPTDDTEKLFGHVFQDKSEGEYKNDVELKDIIKAYSVDGESPKMEVELTGLSAGNTATVAVELAVTIYGETAMDAVLEAASESISTERFDELQNFIKSVKVSETVATKMLEMVGNSLPQDESRIPVKTIFNNHNEIMEDLLYSIVSGSNTMLSGPMAAGKNTALECLAHNFGKALYEVQVNSYIDNDVLLGTRTIVAKDGAANSEEINKQGRLLIQALAENFVGQQKSELKDGVEHGDVASVEAIANAASELDFSILIQAMKDAQTEVDFQPGVIPIAMETGSWVVVDEFNAGPPAVMAVLNSVLDARKRIQVPGYGLVKAAEGFRLFATMNPNYEGTFTLNPATASRFNFVLFDAADSITGIIQSRVPDAKSEYLKAAEKVYKHLRSDIDAGKAQEDSINIRGFIEGAKQNSMGRGIKRALMTCVVNGINDLDDRNAMKSFIDVSFGEAE